MAFDPNQAPVLSFNGINSVDVHDSVGDVLGLLEAAGELTFEFWVRRGNTPLNSGQMLVWGTTYPPGTSDPGYQAIRIWISTDKLAFEAGGGPTYMNGVGVGITDMQAFLPQGTWVHLAFTKKNSANRMFVYRNGEEIGSGVGGYDRQAHDSPVGLRRLRFGKPIPKTHGVPSWMEKYSFVGDLAGVRVWTVERSQPQIAAGMYAATTEFSAEELRRVLVYGPGAGTAKFSLPPVPPSRPAIFFAAMEAKKIQRLGADGTLADVVQCAEMPRGVAVDRTGGKIYWSETSAHRIKRANLDGSAEEIIANGSAASLPLDLELDLPGQKIYWTDPGLKRVLRADLTGANQQVVTSGGAALGLALDLAQGKAYVGEGGGLSAQRILSVNLDGSGRTILFDTAALPNRDLMDLEVGSDKLYWVNGKEIEQCNLDGSGRTVLIGGLSAPRSLEVDRTGNKIYWTEGNTVRRAGLDGSGVETVHALTSAGGLEHLELVQPS